MEPRTAAATVTTIDLLSPAIGAAGARGLQVDERKTLRQ